VNLLIIAEVDIMAVTLQKILPGDIEGESFRIIKEEFGPTDLDENTFKIIQRVIHATGDFSFKDTMRFSPGAIEAGIKAIREGKDILTDVTMVASGISKTMLAKWGGKVVCKVADPEVAARAKAENKTRSELAIEMSLNPNIGIVAMGNAPTALVQTIRSLAAGNPDHTPLIVGVPVGFVNAAESKDLLVEQHNCYITSLGRKGGSPVAAAIINALIRLAAE
jgi:precorrin-8X/cobalt-precorrin-8 methylmutase